MAAEEITKFAINRTLGTDNFKPLDQMIIEQTRMIPTDDLYSNLAGGEIRSLPDGEEETLILPYRIKMIRYGTVRFKGVLHRTWTRYTRGSFTIYKNDVQVYEWYRNWDTGSSDEDFSIDISFKPNDVFSFELYSRAGGRTVSFSLSNFGMYGTIAHNIYEVIE